MSAENPFNTVVNEFEKDRGATEESAAAITSSKGYIDLIEYIKEKSDLGPDARVQFVSLVEGLSPGARQFLLSDLGGSWRDLKADTIVNMDELQKAFAEYESACVTSPVAIYNPLPRRDAFQKIQDNIES